MLLGALSGLMYQHLIHGLLYIRIHLQPMNNRTPGELMRYIRTQGA